MKIEELLLVALAGGGIWLAYKAGVFTKYLNKEENGNGTSPTPSPSPTPTTPPSTTTPSNCTSTIFPKGTKTWTPKYNGGQGITYSSSGEKATSYRWDADGVTSPSLEATYYVTWPTGSAQGDHLELKFWGPGHSDGSCCWCMFNVHGDGRTGAGHEGPHPSTSNFSTKGKNVGSIKGKLVGIKGVIWPIATGAHLEGYMDVTGTGKWDKVVTYEGACGKSKKSTKPVASQQIQFRVDNIEPKMKCAVISEIKPAAVSAYTYSYNPLARITIA